MYKIFRYSPPPTPKKKNWAWILLNISAFEYEILKSQIFNWQTRDSGIVSTKVVRKKMIKENRTKTAPNVVNSLFYTSLFLRKRWASFRGNNLYATKALHGVGCHGLLRDNQKFACCGFEPRTVKTVTRSSNYVTAARSI